MDTNISTQFGIWGVFCTGVDYGRFDPVAIVKGWRPDTDPNRNAMGRKWYNDYLDAAAEKYGYTSWDDLPEDAVDHLLDPNLWEVRPVDSTFRHLDGSPVLFVNVYYIDQGYGGPEEGGWYFETGMPICSYVAPGDFESAMTLRAEVAKEYTDEGHRFRVLPQGRDYMVVVELDPPADPWPARKPHYE